MKPRAVVRTVKGKIMSIESDRWKQVVSNPFLPMQVSVGIRSDTDYQLRIATALEYIAAQLGEINARLAKHDVARK
jgi:hypothetical protein